MLPKRTTSRSSLLTCYQRTQEPPLATCYYLRLLCYCVFKPLTLSPPLRGGREGFHFANPFVTIHCYSVTVSSPSPAKSSLFFCYFLLLLCYCVFPSSLAKSSLFFCYFLLLLCYCVFNPLLCLLPFGEAGRGFTLRSLCYYLLLLCYCVFNPLLCLHPRSRERFLNRAVRTSTGGYDYQSRPPYRQPPESYQAHPLSDRNSCSCPPPQTSIYGLSRNLPYEDS